MTKMLSANDVLATHDREIKQAFMGDSISKQLLAKIAQDCLDQNLLSDAALLFKELAAAHRVGEFRASAMIEDATKTRTALSSEIFMLETWIQAHPSGFERLPMPASGVSNSDIWEVLQGGAFSKTSVIALSVLEDELTKIGEQFFSPGGTPARRACTLLEQYFGLERTADSNILEIQRVRIALDLLADAVIRKAKKLQI